MRALLRAAGADLRGRLMQTLLLFAIVAIAALGITAGLGQQRSAAERWDDAFARANGAHVALYGAPVALERARAMPGVVQSAGPIPVTSATLVHRGREFEDVEVRAAGARLPAVGIPLMFGGRWLTDDDAGAVVVGRSFAVAEDVEVGDGVRLQGDAGAVDARVVGVALDLVDCFYPLCGSEMAWANPAAVDRLRGRDTGALMLLRVADTTRVEAYAARAKQVAGPGLEDLEQSADTRSNALAINDFFGAFLATFGVFLLIAAGIVILSTVSARVLARYRELGILKALGFTPRALALLVLGENLLIALAGAATGVLAGGLLAPGLQLQMASVLERGRATFPPGVLAASIGIVLVVVAAATLVPALRAGRVPASRAIARGAERVSMRTSRSAALAARLRLGPAVAVGLRDAGSRPLRSVLATAALVVTVIAIVAALAFDRTVQAVDEDNALAGTPESLAVEGEGVRPQALASLPGVAATIGITERQVAVGDVSFQISVLSGDLSRSGYVIREGRMLAGPGEAVIGYGLQERLDRGVGDRLPLLVGGRRRDLRIVGRYAEADDAGQRALIGIDSLRTIEPSATPDAFLLRLAPGADSAAVARAARRALPGAEVTADEADTEVFDAFRAAFYVIAALVLAVGAANLVGTTVLGVRERLHDIAVLKALGFTPRQVTIAIATASGALGVPAVLIGVPAGLLIARAMLQEVGRGAGIGPELATPPGAAGVALAAVGVVVLAAAVGAVTARRAARAPAAVVLRAE